MSHNPNLNRTRITFSFGDNWKSFLKNVSEASIQSAQADIIEWLGKDKVRGKTVVDVGCGSGIHSLVYYLLGATQLVSIDIDPKCVEATLSLWKKAGQPLHWRVLQGSILDQDFLCTLGGQGFEIVYSWGVLHHTGAVWEALNNASRLCSTGGLCWIAMYQKGPNYPHHLATKIRYNQASFLGKKRMVIHNIVNLMRQRYRSGQNPFTWNKKQARGMDTYHDLIDWLGGLPYEVCSIEEVFAFMVERGFIEKRILERGEGANNIFLFQRLVSSEKKPGIA